MKHPFEYQAPTPSQVEQITAIQEALKIAYDALMQLPAGRERSLAITKLEEVSMWANRGIVFAEEAKCEPVKMSGMYPVGRK